MKMHHITLTFQDRGIILLHSTQSVPLNLHSYIGISLFLNLNIIWCIGNFVLQGIQWAPRKRNPWPSPEFSFISSAEKYTFVFSCNHYLPFVNFVKLSKLQQIIITITPIFLLNAHADKATTQLRCSNNNFEQGQHPAFAVWDLWNLCGLRWPLGQGQQNLSHLLPNQLSQ